jgi:plasmid stabilization system protein ParE
MRVRYTDTALAEIDEIISYIARDNPRAAAEVAAAIEKTIASSAQRPASAPVVYAGEVRAKMVGRYQYRVFMWSVETTFSFATCGARDASGRGKNSNRLPG